MRVLIPHIETLLMEHDCVIVPNLGAFVLQHHSAQIKGSILLPPHTTVSFNPSLTTDDALLSTRLVKTLNIRYPQAKQLIAAAVEQFRQDLQNEPQQLGRLGQMTLLYEISTTRPHLLFTPSSCRFLPTNIGLPTTALRPKQSQTISNHLKQIQTISNDSKPSQTISNDSKPSQITLTFRRSTIRYAAACALLLILWALPVERDIATRADYASILPINFTQIVAQQEAELTAQQEAERLLAEEQQRIEERSHYHFHLIIASLTTQKQAEQFLQELQHEYPDAYLLNCGNQRYRIAIEAYPTKRQAINAMQDLRDNTRFTHAWVFCN